MYGNKQKAQKAMQNQHRSKDKHTNRKTTIWIRCHSEQLQPKQMQHKALQSSKHRGRVEVKEEAATADAKNKSLHR
jgi:hypothetical protein